MKPGWHIDTDCGVDDALALIVLVRSGVPIASVGSVFGNTWVDQAALNARMVLRQSGCEAEVYIGAGHSLTRRPPARDQRGHGHDGLNGFGASQRRTLPPLQRPHSLNLISLAARCGSRGLFLGPVTNLANALLDDPKAFVGWRPVLMAGAFGVHGRGHSGSDFNSWSDPEALQRVLLTGVRPQLVPLDISSTLSIPAERFETAAAGGWPLMARLAKAVRPYIDFQSKHWDGLGCHPHDVVAAGAVAWPELYRFTPATLSLDSEQIGRILRTETNAPNADICVEVDGVELQRRVLAALFD